MYVLDVSSTNLTDIIRLGPIPEILLNINTVKKYRRVVYFLAFSVKVVLLL